MTRRPAYRLAWKRLGLVAPLAAFGVVVLGVLVNGLYEVVKDALGGSAALVAVGALAVLVGVAAALARFVTPGPIGPVSQGLAPKSRGLVLLVSNADSAKYAVLHHFTGGPLERVWLIASGDTDAAEFGPGTLKLAGELKAWAATLGRPLDIQVLQAVSAAEAHDTFDAVRRIYRTCGLPPAEVIADFTGGTKPMTVGLILASLDAERPLQYTSWHKPSNTMHGPFLIDYRHEAFDIAIG